MQHAGPMALFQNANQLETQVHGLLPRPSTGQANGLSQGRTVDQLGHQVRHPLFGDARVVHGDHVGVARQST